MFKKIAALCLAACLCLGFAGCGKMPAQQQPASGGAPQSQGAASGSAPASQRGGSQG